MSKLATTIFVAVTLACGTGAFYITRLIAAPTPDQDTSSCSWLKNEPREILQIEEAFNNNVKLLSQDIQTQRTDLSTLFCDTQATDESIRQQTQKVIDAQKTLMLSVADHITKMRNKLSPAQKKFLMSLCAETARGPIRKQQRRGQRGQYGPDTTNMPRGNGNGKGNGQMQKRRMAMNHQTSCGPKIHRLAQNLNLTDQQLALLTENNPQIELNCRSNCAELAQNRADLLALFEDQNSTNAQITRTIDSITQIHSRIELSITEFIIILRPTLTAQQKLTLSTLCSNCPNM